MITSELEKWGFRVGDNPNDKIIPQDLVTLEQLLALKPEDIRPPKPGSKDGE
jgi:hypothetical protein